MLERSPIVHAYGKLISNGRLQPNPAQQGLVNRLGQLQQTLMNVHQNSLSTRSEQHRHGMYIYGGVGTGKSRIADLFAFTLPETINCRRVHFHEFMVDVHTRLHHARSQSTYTGDPLLDIGKAICSESPVLCFDEFQVSDIADAMILKRLFGSFWNSGGVMVSTSNRHPTDLYKNGLNRPLFTPFIRELQDRCLVWKVQGDVDYRMNIEASKRTPVFHTDSSVFTEILKKATDGHESKDLELTVAMNRTITVQSYAPQCIRATDAKTDTSSTVVKSSFKQLCQANLGASDFHALCKYARTIFLSGLRAFTATELDFVRRFITLIDVAYETRTRIICLSAVPLSSLFENLGVRPSNNADSDKGDNNDHYIGITVKGEGGSSSSMMSTFINDVEWSATGLTKASLATGGAGETDVRFALGRAISRLAEMESSGYGSSDGE